MNQLSSSNKKVTGGGKADTPGKLVFNATFTYLADMGLQNNYLYSYYELDSPKDFEYLEHSIRREDRILIDSGTHGIYMKMAREGTFSILSADRRIDINSPELTKYFDEYCRFLHKYEGKLWGYVELDIGNTEQKTLLRERMESRGLVPIPVVHPVGDDSAYLHYLLQNYDRVAFGNVAMEADIVRRTILDLANVAKLKYPDVWIHILGLGVHYYLLAYPLFDSIDTTLSSALIRFGRLGEGGCCTLHNQVSDGFQVRRGDRDNYMAGAALGYRLYNWHSNNWQYFYNQTNV